METNSTKKPFSRYSQGGESFVTTDNKIRWWERFHIEEADDDLLIEILPKYDRRPDRLAAELYGKSELHWVLLQMNVILDINEEFTTGKIIKAPHPDRLTTSLLNKKLGGTNI